GFFELRVLLGFGLRRRTYLLPNSEGVAMLFIDAEMLQARLAAREWETVESQLDRRVRSGHVVIVIVPHEDAEFVSFEARQRGHVRLGAGAAPDDFLQRHGVVAFHREPLAADFGEHSENIEHGFVDTIARQRTESGEVRLVLEFKSPGEGDFNVQAMP